MPFKYHDGSTEPPSLDEFIQKQIDFAFDLTGHDRELFYGLYVALGVLDMFATDAFHEYIILYGTNAVPYILSEDEARRGYVSYKIISKGRKRR